MKIGDKVCVHGIPTSSMNGECATIIGVYAYHAENTFWIIEWERDFDLEHMKKFGKACVMTDACLRISELWP